MHLHINTQSMMTSSEANDQSPKDLNNHRIIINRKMLYCKRPSWISQLRVEVKKNKKTPQEMDGHPTDLWSFQKFLSALRPGSNWKRACTASRGGS